MFNERRAYNVIYIYFVFVYFLITENKNVSIFILPSAFDLIYNCLQGSVMILIFFGEPTKYV